MMRYLTTALWLCFLGLTGCGGGAGGGSGTGFLSTKTSGNITALGGQSSAVAGVELDCPATGGRSRSDAAGHFDLGDLPADRVDINIRTPGHGRDIVINVDLRGGGEAVLRIEVDDDGIRRVSVEHCDDDGEENRTRARLVAVEDGLEGKVQIGKNANDDQTFEVEVEGLASGRTIEVFVVNAADVEESQGTFVAGAEGEAELEIETEHGDLLPHGVADVAELEGFGVIVRDATTGDDLMTGTVPELGRIPPACDKHDGDDDDDEDDGDDGDDDEHDVHHRGRTRLTNADGVTGEAKAGLRDRPERQKLAVEVEHTGVTDPIEFWLEDPANLGTFVLIGTLTAHEDELQLELDTGDGDLLPFGVTDVKDLVGLQVELRNGTDGSVLFTGALPPLNPS